MNIVCGTRLYKVTNDDVLWLQRAVQHEGRVHEQVAQTLINCFAFLHSKKPKSCPTLTWLVRSYAQPINPLWFPEGRIFKRWHAMDPKKYSMVAARRRRDVLSKVTKFYPVTLEAVSKALADGPVSIPANCTDYAAAWIDASRKYKALTKPEHGRNRLWTRAAAWQGYRVK